MTATVGRALTESSRGYISGAGAAIMNGLVITQRENLYGGSTFSIVAARTTISEALRSLITSAAQKASLAALRKKYMTVTYPGGATVDYSAQNTYYLYAAEVPASSSTLSSYTSDAFTDLFFKRF
jgi:hypothetical protein